MSCAAGIDLLAARIAAVADELVVTMSRAQPPVTLRGPFIATGTGGSEGPARIFVAAQCARGQQALFVPLSTFAGTSELACLDRSASLWIFSQGICPNATMALAACSRFAASFIVTALSPDGEAPPRHPQRRLADAARHGATLIAHGPRDERGLLVRVIGPAAATLTALRWAADPPPADLPERYRCALSLAQARIAALAGALPRGESASQQQQVALVTCGSYLGLTHGLRWKLFEATAIPDPPVWDVLQFAHGPFQQLYARPMLLCGLQRPGDAPMFDRLQRLLVADRHALLRLPATLAPPWCWFEHDAMLNALALALLRARPVDLLRWPGQGADGELYGWDGSDGGERCAREGNERCAGHGSEGGERYE